MSEFSREDNNNNLLVADKLKSTLNVFNVNGLFENLSIDNWFALGKTAMGLSKINEVFDGNGKLETFVQKGCRTGVRVIGIVTDQMLGFPSGCSISCDFTSSHE